MMDLEPAEDSTTVIRMKRDFNSFLSNKSYHGGPQLDLSRPTTDVDSTADVSFLSSRSKLSIKTLLDKEKESRLKDAEIAAAKSKIAELQSEVASAHTASKRVRIEMEKDLGCLRNEREHDGEKIQEVRAQLKFVCDRESILKEELNSLREELKQRKVDYEEKMLALQKDKLQLQDDMEQMRKSSWEKCSELKKELLRSQTELQITQNDVEEVKSQLQTQCRRSADLTSQLKELEEYRYSSVQATGKIKDLELKISRMEEDAVIAKAMKSQLTAMPELEKEVEKLREENANLRDTQENILLLKEQAESYKTKLERSEHRFADCAKLEADNAELRLRLEKWETAEAEGGRYQTPVQLHQRIGYLQESQVVLLEKQGQLQSSLHSQEESKRVLQEKLNTMSRQHTQDKNKLQQQVELLKRLQRKLLLISKERDSYKQIIDSYESEVTVNIEAHTANRLHHQEEVIEGYRKQMEQLEAEVTRLSNQNKSASQSASFMADVNGSSRPVEDQANQKIILQLRKRIETLEKQLEKTEEEKFTLESRIEQRNLQGDYDPTKTKVLHFSMNPLALAQQQKKGELSRLQEENERLKQRLQLLESAEGQVEDLTMKVEQKLQEPSTSKEVDDMKAQLNKEEMKNKRLMEVFKQRSQEFREVCYQLTGFRIDISSSNQYKLTSMYSESPDDFFLFQKNESGEVQMLGTDFTNTLKDLIEMYLQKHDSIPAFLSTVTLDLFRRQTINLG